MDRSFRAICPDDLSMAVVHPAWTDQQIRHRRAGFGPPPAPKSGAAVADLFWSLPCTSSPTMHIIAHAHHPLPSIPSFTST